VFSVTAAILAAVEGGNLPPGRTPGCSAIRIQSKLNKTVAAKERKEHKETDIFAISAFFCG